MLYDFEAFRVDFDSHQLFRGDVEVHLSPKALQLLQVLMETRPKAMSKSELHEHLWPSTFVTESNLASLINEVRRALNEDGHAPRFIRTVHGFGYAFSGDPLESIERGAHRGSAAAKLVWDKGEALLRPGRNIIGRDADAAVQIDDRTISRQHAVITIGENRVTVEDLQSKNGTFCEGKRISGPVQLRDGSVVEFGSMRTVLRKISTSTTATLHRRDERA